MNTLENISPLDGRYANIVSTLAEYFSEYALMKYRLKVEVEYLIALGNQNSITDLEPFSIHEETELRKIYISFTLKDAEKIKEIETGTNHDVKAIEYFIREKVKKSLHPWIHFALTSEDVNNIAYSLMWQDGIKRVYLPVLNNVNKELKKLARKNKNVSMLALTHGQPATPTTFGKEIAVFSGRLKRQIDQIKNQKLYGKFGGSTGTWSAHVLTHPKANWIRFSKQFIKKIGLEPNLVTTQIEPHDSLAESYHQIIRINSILTDLCRDMWFYISRGVLGQKRISSETGSSTMPHKINPIQFENAEGNMGISNALLNYIATKLPVSRMQRDLTDSTTIRNQGAALGHSYLALQNILKGLGRITIKKEAMSDELNNHWEVLAEAVQTLLRKAGKPDAYEQLKAMTRGQDIDQEIYIEFVSGLAISDEDKKMLLQLTPEKYIGLASDLVNII